MWFRNCPRFEDKCKSCLSALSPTSQLCQLTRILPSSIHLFNIAQLCFQCCQNAFPPVWRSSRTWVPLQGCGSFCFQRCRGGRGSSSTLLIKPQMTGSMGGRGGSEGVQDPLVSSSNFFQTGVDHWEYTSPELLMCALSARTPAGNVAVLGYLTKTSGVHKLLKSAHGLKQKRSNSIFQIAFFIHLCEFFSLYGHLRFFPLQTEKLDKCFWHEISLANYSIYLFTI